MRVDSGLEAGSEVTPLYDPMVAKLITWDVDREKATARMLRALGEYRIEPLVTLIPFHQAILATEQWAKGETCRDLHRGQEVAEVAGAGGRRPPRRGDEEDEPTEERTYKVEVDGRLHEVKVIGAAAPAAGGAGGGRSARRRSASAARRRVAVERAARTLSSPLQGTVLKVAVEKGQEVAEGDLICVIEAMKMENEITAHVAGKVTELAVSEGGSVNSRRPDREDRVAARQAPR